MNNKSQANKMRQKLTSLSIGIVFIINFLIISELLYSQTKPDRIFKNLGSLINTSSNEFQPVIFNDTLYFRRSDNNKPNDDDIYFIAMKDITCPSSNRNKMNPINLYKLKTTKSKNLLMFNSTPGFYIFNSEDAFSNNLDKSINQTVLNSEFNDIHPAISKDGQIIVFASDRGGDHSNTDLYVTLRKPDGSWSPPKVLSSGLKGINTAENEITPCIAPDGTLYYASKGFPINNTEYYFSATEQNTKSKTDIYKTSAKINYNIVRAEPVPGIKGNWRNPKVLSKPFNTNWDDIGPALFVENNYTDTLLFLSSNRKSVPDWGDSYGAFDLYGFCLEKCIDCFDSCTKYLVEGFVSIECKNINDYPGKMKIYHKEGFNLVLDKELFVNNNGKFSYILPLPYDGNFVFEYTHPCLEEPIRIDTLIKCIKQNNYNCKDCSTNTPEIQKIVLNTFNIGHPCCCKPVELELQLNCYNRKKKGMYYDILNFDNKIVANGNVDKKGKIKATLEYSEKFTVNTYFNCNGKTKFSTEIIPKCSKNKINKEYGNIFIPLECCCTSRTFDGREYSIPFFVTGYYYPTTTEQYDSLLSKLSGIFLNNDNVRYIDTSDYGYKQTFKMIQDTLNEVVDFIKSKIDDECSYNLIEVIVEGYADPDSIVEGVKFDDSFSIDNDIVIDKNIDINSLKNARQKINKDKPIMTNDTLSFLRAYNTVQMLKKMLAPVREGTTEIKWEAKGMGECQDKDINNYPYCRTIKITINSIENK
jgi:hypothetical protein